MGRTNANPILAAFLVALSGSLPAPALCRAATFRVTKTADTADGACDADCSLREAIVAANADPGPDTIVVPVIESMPTVYSLSITGIDEDAALTGDLDLATPMTIAGAGQIQVVIDATNLGDRIFHLPQSLGGAAVEIRDLAMRKGRADIAIGAPPESTLGGGIFNHGGALSLKRVAILECYGWHGGGIANDSPTATLEVEHLFIWRNQSVTEGGGISNRNGATARIVESTIQENTAITGAGATNRDQSSRLTVERATIRGNRALGTGGGIAAYSEGTLALANSAILANTSMTNGAGIFVNGAVAMVTNTSIAHNALVALATDTMFDGGSGFFLGDEQGGLVSLSHVTIAENDRAEAQQLRSNAPDGALEIANSIIGDAPNNTEHFPVCMGPITSLGGNVSVDSSCGFEAPPDRIGVDPQISAPGAFGGPTFAYPISVGSPAIGAGVPEHCEPFDQRGFERDEACDAGAYEHNALPGCGPDWPGPADQLGAIVGGFGGDVGRTVLCLLGRTEGP